MQRKNIIELFNDEVYTNGHGRVGDFEFFTRKNPYLKMINAYHDEFTQVCKKIVECESRVSPYSQNIRDMLTDIISDIKGIWGYNESCYAIKLNTFIRNQLPNEYTIWTDKTTYISNYLNIYNEETVTEGEFNCDNYRFYNNKIRLSDELIDQVKDIGNNIEELLKLKSDFDQNTLDRAHLIQQMYIGDRRKRKTCSNSGVSKKAKPTVISCVVNSMED